MKQWLAIVALSVVLSSCAAFNAATIGDDMYSAHSRTEIANRQKAAAEAARAEAEARQAEWEAQGNSKPCPSLTEDTSVLRGQTTEKQCVHLIHLGKQDYQIILFALCTGDHATSPGKKDRLHQMLHSS